MFFMAPMLSTNGGMKSLGIAGYFSFQLHRTYCVAETLHNHLNPNVLYRMLAAGDLFPLLFLQFICFSQYFTIIFVLYKMINSRRLNHE